MDKEIFITDDGSHSISIPALNASYHSTHGALQESRHIFIEAGLKPLLAGETSLSNPDLESQFDAKKNHLPERSLSIFELGLGTGLNVLLTLMETESRPVKIYYEAIEAYPVEIEIAEKLNFPEIIEGNDVRNKFLQIHQVSWDSPQQLSENFTLHKRYSDISEADLNTWHITNSGPIVKNTDLNAGYDLIYFDAFAPDIQSSLWTTAIFTKLYNALHPSGVLVTYCSKSSVRRSMVEAGFIVEKIPGPRGKREIVRARKLF